MSEATSTDQQAVGEPERLHPLFLLTGLGGSLRGLAGGYAAIAYLGVSGRLTEALLAALALLVAVGIGILLYWTRFQFVVGDSDIRIDSGILSRTHRSIPFDRIQDVDISQGPLARLAGLARVSFETGGASGSGKDEGVLHAISLRRAEEIRQRIRAHRSTPAELQPAEGPEPGPVYALGTRRLVLAGIFNFSLAVFAGLFGLTQTAGDALGFDPLNRGFWQRLLSASSPLLAFVLAHRTAAVAAGLVLLLLVGLATGIVRTLLRDFGFRLDRAATGLRRRRGLLTRTDVTLPVRRAQAAVIATGPLRSALGLCELRLQTLASDDGGKGDHVLAPLATGPEVEAILAELGWRPLPDGIAWKRVSKAYVWVRAAVFAPVVLAASAQVAVIALYPGGDGAAAPAAAMLLPTLVLATVLGIPLLLRWLGWHRTGYALDGDRLLVRSGWWRRRILVLPLRRIQSIDLTENILTRLFGTASLLFGVAGGRAGFGLHRIEALPRETARALRRELLSPVQ